MTTPLTPTDTNESDSMTSESCPLSIDPLDEYFESMNLLYEVSQTRD